MRGIIEISDSRRVVIAPRHRLILPESPMLESVRRPKGRIDLTVIDAGTDDVALDSLLMRVKRDNATTSATGIRVT